jgi:hypothetical protein
VLQDPPIAFCAIELCGEELIELWGLPTAPATSGPAKVQTHDQKAAVDFRDRLIHYGDDI